MQEYDMLIRKKALKIQERLGMRIGIMYGTKNIPMPKTAQDITAVLYELYKIGIKAYILPSAFFSGIRTTTDLYKGEYGNLLKIKEMAMKYNIELSLYQPDLPENPDEMLKTFCTIASIMNCRSFFIQPTFYQRMPNEQALRLVVYKINEITTSIRNKIPIGIETMGRVDELGSLEEVIDMVKRTTGTEPIINWGNIHARGSGALRSEDDFMRIIEKTKRELGAGWAQRAFFLFSGTAYGPSGKTRTLPLDQSDIKLEYLIREALSFGLKGTLIFDDPDKDKFFLRILEGLGEMVR